MKAINSSSLLQTAILVASLSSSLGSQLRANWRVTYDTTSACQFGTIATTVQKPSTSTATFIVFRVADGSSSSPYYTKTGKIQSNTGKAKMALPMTEVFKIKTSNRVCSLQIGTSIVTVKCPTMPVCAPTMAPTQAPTLAPTQAPTSAPTVNPLYDVATNSPVPFTQNCQSGTLSVAVAHNGQPVSGAALDLTVMGYTRALVKTQYHLQGTTDTNGKATFTVTLNEEDRFWKNWQTSLIVTNPKAPAGSQTFTPFIFFDCPHS